MKSLAMRMNWSGWSLRELFADHATTAVIMVVMGVLIPGYFCYWLVVSPFLVIFYARYVLLGLVLLLGFIYATGKAPWPVRLITSMVLGQIVLNYGFTNMVIGVGGAKFTLAESGVLVGLAVLMPQVFPLLRQMRIFWVCMFALVVPPLVHLVPDVSKYGMSALRDVLSVVDLIYFLAGLTVCAYGLRLGQWLPWRNRFLSMWIIAGALYGLLSPASPYIMAVSPSFQSYQQKIPVLGHMVTAAYNAIGAAAAWYAIPHVFPRLKWLRWVVALAAILSSLVTIGLAQSRNLYIIFFMLPVALAYFGYRKAFLSTFAAMLALLFSLFLLETFEVKIPGRISNVTLSAVIDRAMTVSGKHGDEAGARGVSQRMDWWASAIDKWRASPETIVLGVGYGPALTNFTSPGGDYNEGVVVREPHNSFISSLARGGLIYFLPWLYLLFAPMRMAIKGSKLPGLGEDYGGAYKGVSSWAVIMMLMCVVGAFSEPVFETPSFAAMYYFLSGFVVVEYLAVTRRIDIPERALA
jgi:O-antigen ligase